MLTTTALLIGLALPCGLPDRTLIEYTQGLYWKYRVSSRLLESVTRLEKDSKPTYHWGPMQDHIESVRVEKAVSDEKTTALTLIWEGPNPTFFPKGDKLGTIEDLARYRFDQDHGTGNISWISSQGLNKFQVPQPTSRWSVQVNFNTAARPFRYNFTDRSSSVNFEGYEWLDILGGKVECMRYQYESKVRRETIWFNPAVGEVLKFEYDADINLDGGEMTGVLIDTNAVKL